MICRALLGLGSNLGDRLATLRSAVAALERLPQVAVVAASGVYENPPLGTIPQDDYLNAVVLVTTGLSARDLLAALLRIEQEHGRVREVKWGPRTLDLDLLWLEGVELDEPGLTVPHPGLATRPFVLRPVAELLPDLVLPDGRTAARAVEELADDACVRLQGENLRR